MLNSTHIYLFYVIVLLLLVIICNSIWAMFLLLLLLLFSENNATTGSDLRSEMNTGCFNSLCFSFSFINIYCSNCFENINHILACVIEITACVIEISTTILLFLYIGFLSECWFCGWLSDMISLLWGLLTVTGILYLLWNTLNISLFLGCDSYSLLLLIIVLVCLLVLAYLFYFIFCTVWNNDLLNLPWLISTINTNNNISNNQDNNKYMENIVVLMNHNNLFSFLFFLNCLIQISFGNVFYNNYYVVSWFINVSFVLVYVFVGILIFFTSSLWLLYFGLELQWMLFIIFFVIGNSIWNGLINYVIFNELVGTLLILGLILYINIFFSSLYYGNIGFYPFMIPMIGILLDVSYLYFIFDPLNNFLYFSSFISLFHFLPESVITIVQCTSDSHAFGVCSDCSCTEAWSQAHGNLSMEMFLVLLNFYMIYVFGINFIHSINTILLVSSLINFLLIIMLLIFSEAFLFAIIYFLIYYFTIFFFLTSLIFLFNTSYFAIIIFTYGNSFISSDPFLTLFSFSSNYNNNFIFLSSNIVFFGIIL